jgi:hypothetical protein
MKFKIKIQSKQTLLKIHCCYSDLRKNDFNLGMRLKNRLNVFLAVKNVASFVREKLEFVRFLN